MLSFSLDLWRSRTHVTTYALFGEWRAEAYIGDTEAPCSRALEFVLEP